MSESLQALERLGKFRNEDGMFAFQSKDYFFIEKELKALETLEKEKQSFDRQLEKKLKTLEIIKELFVFQPDKFYPFIWKELNTPSKEKIELLKEVLTDE